MTECEHVEKLIMRKYYVRAFINYIILIVLYTIASLAFFCGGFILRKKFPIDAVYPFSTDAVLVTIIVYIHQTFCIMQNSVIIIIDLLIITLFWYAGARIKILGYRLKTVSDDDQLRKCILEHQEINQ